LSQGNLIYLLLINGIKCFANMIWNTPNPPKKHTGYTAMEHWRMLHFQSGFRFRFVEKS
jgi:hypothetical protein